MKLTGGGGKWSMTTLCVQSEINDGEDDTPNVGRKLGGIFTSYLTVVIDCADKANRHVIQDTSALENDLLLL